MRSKTRRPVVLALTVAAALVAAVPAATGAATTRTVAHPVGPRGLDIGPGGALVVATANGAYGRIVRAGEDRGQFRRLGRVPGGFIAAALDMSSNGELYVLTTGGPADAEGAGTLFRWTKADGQVEVADIQAYQRTDPDPWDLEKKPRESNPFGVAALDDGGALVADAAGNDLLRVSADGAVETIATFKPRTVRVPRGLGEDAPPAGTPMPSESVPTSVTVGPDGYYYVGELRGFPARPGTSQIWRINPNATDAVCDPAKPFAGQCRRVVANMTSIVGLQAGPGGSLFVVQLADHGWLKAETGGPADMVGSLIRVGVDRKVRTELGKGTLPMPGDVALGPDGGVFVTTPVFGPGKIVRLR